MESRINVAIELNNLIDSECCVCLDIVDMYVKDSFIQMKCCLQNLHKGCFLEWIGTKKENTNTCLICRTEFDSILNYVSLQEVLSYTDSHKHTINIFNYALGNIFRFDNINICIVDPLVPQVQAQDQHADNLTRLNMLSNKLTAFIVSSVLILLLLISILSNFDKCSA